MRILCFVFCVFLFSPVFAQFNVDIDVGQYVAPYYIDDGPQIVGSTVVNLASGEHTFRNASNQRFTFNVLDDGSVSSLNPLAPQVVMKN